MGIRRSAPNIRPALLLTGLSWSWKSHIYTYRTPLHLEFQVWFKLEGKTESRLCFVLLLPFPLANTVVGCGFPVETTPPQPSPPPAAVASQGRSSSFCDLRDAALEVISQSPTQACFFCKACNEISLLYKPSQVNSIPSYGTWLIPSSPNLSYNQRNKNCLLK